MLKRFACISGVLLVLLPFSASGATWIDTVVLFDQPSGSSTSANDPQKALGSSDGTFVSVDIPETLILCFSLHTVFDGSGNDIHVYEVGLDHSFIDVYGSLDGNSWTFLASGEGEFFIDLSTSGLEALKYLKFIGVDNLGDYPGYDLDAVEALNATPDFVNFALNRPVAVTTNGVNEYYEGSGENPEDITDGAVGEHLFEGCVGYRNEDYYEPMEVEVIIDLGATYNITQIRYNMGNVHRANTWNADRMISEFGDTATNPGGSYVGAWTTHSGSMPMSKVKITFEKTRTSWDTDWLFIGEIEVYGTEVSKMLDVPSYFQDDFPGSCDCSPTSGAMVLGYWDSHGWPRMVPGGSSDYNENREGVENLVSDLKETMLYDGSTKPENIGPGIVKTASNMDPGAKFSYYSFTITSENKDLAFLMLKSSIDNGWPVVFSTREGLIFYSVHRPGYMVVPNPNPTDEGHTMTMFGYQDSDDGRWIGLNTNIRSLDAPDDVGWANFDNLGLNLSDPEPQIFITCVVPGGHPAPLSFPWIPLLLLNE